MRVFKRASVAAISATLVLAAAACSGGDDNEGAATDDKTATGAIVVDGSQPEVGLIPANTTETGGGDVIDYMWSGLVRYDNKTGEPSNLVAESIDSTDSKVYTIKIKAGTKFHDGTEVKAKNFVDAWNWAAYSPNGAQNSSFFSDIAGFADVQSVDPDEDGPKKAPTPKADKMSGLEVVDDQTFKVTLNAPFSIFPVKLGYSAFVPLPDAFFSSTPEAFGKQPIGNGPVKFVSWQDDVEIKLTRFDEYNLDDKVKVKDVTVKLYQDQDAAYQDLLSDNLDFQQVIPPSALAGEKWKTDLGERGIEAPVPTTGIIAFPMYDPKFKSVDLRKAISLAINRDEINEKIFFGTRPPATSWSNPLAPGAGTNDCTVCKYDATEAKSLLQKAGGWKGEMVFYYNADGAHKEWMEAAAQSVKNTLGIEARAEGLPTFAVFRQQVNAHKMNGPYRAAWQEDYPDVENWVGPLYVTGGSSNDGLYSNPQVDALYKEGTAAADTEAAHAKFAEATKLIDADVPSMPIYFYSQQSGFSNKVKNGQVTWQGAPDLSSFEIA
jgi:oligopeptide transport system substrate-binding protein